MTHSPLLMPVVVSRHNDGLHSQHVCRRLYEKDWTCMS